jgi:hypothetical protein
LRGKKSDPRRSVFKLSLKYEIRKVQEDSEMLKLAGLNLILVYADVNFLGENLNTIENKVAILLQT